MGGVTAYWPNNDLDAADLDSDDFAEAAAGVTQDLVDGPVHCLQVRGLAPRSTNWPAVAPPPTKYPKLTKAL